MYRVATPPRAEFFSKAQSSTRYLLLPRPYSTHLALISLVFVLLYLLMVRVGGGNNEPTITQSTKTSK